MCMFNIYMHKGLKCQRNLHLCIGSMCTHEHGYLCAQMYMWTLVLLVHFLSYYYSKGTDLVFVICLREWAECYVWKERKPRILVWVTYFLHSLLSSCYGWRLEPILQTHSTWWLSSPSHHPLFSFYFDRKRNTGGEEGARHLQTCPLQLESRGSIPSLPTLPKADL